jgi:hypothetical protein
MNDLERLQTRLPIALVANLPGSGIDHVVVALASYSVGESLLSHYVERIPAMEHRYLNALFQLCRIETCEFVFLCSQEPTPEIFDYYRRLIGEAAAGRVFMRFRCLVVPDLGARSLAAKLLDRPDMLAQLRELIAGRVAIVEPWNVTEHEVAVALAVGAPINGTSPSLRSLAFKGAGRRLFTEVGVPLPAGREDVRDVDGVLAAIEYISSVRPGATGVVVKHDDSGAGDGNAIIRLHHADGAPLTTAQLRDAVTSLPTWYLADLAAGGVVEELIEGDVITSPSVQFDMLPDGNVRVLATHDQILGGDNGQVYVGCRFPADPGYAPELARHGAAIGAELARRGALGRAAVDFMATEDRHDRWNLYALEINLRKGGTTHPFAALRNLVPGRYDPETGRWVAVRDGSSRSYRSTDNVVEPAWTGRAPTSVIEAVRSAGLEFEIGAGTGIVLHMLSCLAVDGRFGATAIGTTPEHAEDLFEAMLVAVAR